MQGQQESDAIHVQCCDCRRVLGGDGWTSCVPPSGEMTHTYCPECLSEAYLRLEQLKLART